MNTVHYRQQGGFVFMASILLSLVSACDKHDPWPSESGSGGNGGVVIPQATWRLDTDGSGFRSIWGSSGNDIYATTRKGAIYHYDGKTWRFEPVVSSGDTTIVFGTGPKDIMVANERGVIMFFDGLDWRYSYVNDVLVAVGRYPENLAWAVSRFGTVMSRTQSGWQTISEPNLLFNLHDAWMSSTGVLYAVGDNGLILRRSASGWQQMTSGTVAHLTGITGCDSDHISVVGVGGTILNFDDGTWTVQETGTVADLTDIFLPSPSRAFAVGENGTILALSGNEWLSMESGTTGLLTSIWGVDDENIYVTVGDSSVIIHYDGLRWSQLLSQAPRDLNGVWGASTGDIIAVGGGTILHYDGRQWSNMQTGKSYQLRGVWGSSPSRVIAVGDSCILFFDGTTWREMLGSHNYVFNAVHGTSASDVYAVGMEGIICHFDGRSWQDMTSGTSEDLFGVWAYSTNRVFAVGSESTMLLYDGGKWIKIGISYPNISFRSVSASRGNRMYAVGRNGEIFTTWWSGTGWIPAPYAGFCCLDLLSVYGGSNLTACAVGSEGIVLVEDDNARWTTSYPIATRQNLNSVFRFSDDQIVAVGDAGTIVRMDTN